MKVLLVVIDAASPRVLCPAVQTGRLKHLNRLAAAGEMYSQSITIFPSITPAATASIITGSYPAQHGIVGAAWYEEAQDRVAYYGDDFWVVAKEGFGAFLRDFLVHLNGDRLTAPTLFEMSERAGIEAACFNYLVYRGLTTHRVNIPWLLAVLPGAPLTEEVRGPSILHLGDFVSNGRPHHGRGRPRGALHRFGMDDAATATMLCEAAAAGALAPLTVAYFADNDFRSHEVGPHEALPVLDKVDEGLGAVFDAAGGLERLLADTCIIVTSDHGHCDILDDATRAVISLAETFDPFTQAELGESWKETDDILLCPNMRAAQIYIRDKRRVEEVARAALREPRIDAIIRRVSEGSDTPRYRVEGPRGSITFWRGQGGKHARDAFGNAWRWEGDLTTLALEADGSCLESRDYPNAFERIVGALDAENAGDMWVTAQPGCEFDARGSKPHVGAGSHGALHALDSLSPVICAGGRERLPRPFRSIDIAPLCLRALGLA